MGPERSQRRLVAKFGGDMPHSRTLTLATQLQLIYSGNCFGIYQAEVCHLSHAYILLIMRLLEVMIPNITFKFGANNFNFIRVSP